MLVCVGGRACWVGGGIWHHGSSLTGEEWGGGI